MFSVVSVIFRLSLHASVYKMEETVSEKLVAHIWQHQLVTKLITDAEEKVDIIFPGRICSNGGGDFCDAVLTIGNKTTRGNIEIHVRSNQWYSHGHHQDSSYNNVVLHVVMWHDYPTATMLQNGNIVPTVHLWQSLAYPLNRLNQRSRLSYHFSASCPNTKGYWVDESLIDILNTAGKARFASNVASLRRNLASENGGQVLFRNIARALGYDKNTCSFEQLAEMLPLKLLEAVSANDEQSAIHQTLILGTAGLLPSQRPHIKHTLTGEPEIAGLETIWQSSKVTGTMNQSDWHFFRVRPDNFPTRRLAALGYLISRYCQTGLLKSALNMVRESPKTHAYQWIEKGLIIPSQGYWANHIDFGVTTTRRTALMGRSKAAEIVVNILLPFAYVWGELYADPVLQEKALAIYLNYPELGDNHLFRFMKQQLLIRPDICLSASQQQGLIHIFKNYCRHRNCPKCPITLNQN